MNRKPKATQTGDGDMGTKRLPTDNNRLTITWVSIINAGSRYYDLSKIDLESFLRFFSFLLR